MGSRCAFAFDSRPQRPWRGALLVTSAIVPCLMGGSAWAQAADARPDTAVVEEVVITGSRIARPDYSSPSPIVSVGAAAIQQSGTLTAEGALNQLPQFVAGSTSTTNFPGAGTPNIQLRGLGANRTLTLLDGRRFIGNINTIPSALIQNVEIISGGASATYGSDAIAGVVNFKLRNRFEGLTVDAQTGQTERGDGLYHDISVAVGGRFAEDRGNAALAVTRQWRDWSWRRNREFSRVDALSTTLREGRMEINGSNLPSQAAVDAVFAQYGVAPGTVQRATAFGVNTDGTLFRQVGPIINFRGVMDERYAITARGDLNWNGGAYTPLETPIDLYSVFSSADYTLNENITAYGQAMFTHYKSSWKQGSANGALTWIFTVPVTNPFIPADLRTILQSRPNPNAPFAFSKRLEAQPHRIWEIYNDTFQVLGGLKGNVPGVNWSWDAFAAYGVTGEKVIMNSANNQRIQQLLNAADGGQSVCPGGYNPFGDQTYSPECIAYTSAADVSHEEQKLLQFEGTLQGALFSLPAGDLRFALGADYRESTLDTQPGALTLAGLIPNSLAGAPTHGSVSVREAFGELLVPIVRDLPFVEELNIGLGYRYSDYDLTGGIETYKIDGDWKMGAGFAFRSSYQRAVRAPTIVDLFSPGTTTAPNIGMPGPTGSGDPCDINGAYRRGPNAAQVRALCIAQGIGESFVDNFTNPNPLTTGRGGGNPNLDAEKSDTVTAGVVWRSQFDHPLARNFQASIDYFRIELDGAIGSIAPSTSLSRCFNANGTSNPNYSPTNFYCSLIRRNPSGLFEYITETTQNLGGLDISGIDLQADWMLDFEDLGRDGWGVLRVNTVWSHLLKFGRAELPGDPEVDLAGSIGGADSARPEWKGITTVTHQLGPLSTTLKWRYISAMEDISSIGVANSTAVGTPDVNYFDLLGRYDLSDDLTLRAGVINVFDKDPPFYNSAVQSNTDPATFDVLGRRYFIGLTARF